MWYFGPFRVISVLFSCYFCAVFVLFSCCFRAIYVYFRDSFRVVFTLYRAIFVLFRIFRVLSWFSCSFVIFCVILFVIFRDIFPRPTPHRRYIPCPFHPQPKSLATYCDKAYWLDASHRWDRGVSLLRGECLSAERRESHCRDASVARAKTNATWRKCTGHPSAPIVATQQTCLQEASSGKNITKQHERIRNESRKKTNGHEKSQKESRKKHEKHGKHGKGRAEISYK